MLKQKLNCTHKNNSFNTKKQHSICRRRPLDGSVLNLYSVLLYLYQILLELCSFTQVIFKISSTNWNFCKRLFWKMILFLFPPAHKEVFVPAGQQDLCEGNWADKESVTWTEVEFNSDYLLHCFFPAQFMWISQHRNFHSSHKKNFAPFSLKSELWRRIFLSHHGDNDKIRRVRRAYSALIFRKVF